MKLLIAIAFASIAFAQSPSITIGPNAPSPGVCDAPRVGNIYIRSEDPGNGPINVLRCTQTGAASYAFQPIDHLVVGTLPAACAVGDIAYYTAATAGQNLYGCTVAGTWTAQTVGASAPFSGISAGTNTAALVMGTGGSLTTSGSGTIAATSAPFSGVSAGTNAGALVIGTGGSLAVSGSGTIAATSVPASGVTAGALAAGTYTVPTGGSLAISGSGTITASALNGTAIVTGHPTVEGVTSTGATGTGQFVFDTSPTVTTPTISGHLTTTGSAPAITSGCGTGSPALDAAASDSAGTLTFGTSPGTCLLTFASTFSTAPHCTVSFQGGTAGAYAVTATTLTITATGLTGKMDYRCSK